MRVLHAMIVALTSAQETWRGKRLCGVDTDCNETANSRRVQARPYEGPFSLPGGRLRYLRASAASACEKQSVLPVKYKPNSRVGLPSGGWCLRSDKDRPPSERSCGPRAVYQLGLERKGCSTNYTGADGYAYGLPRFHYPADSVVVSVLLKLLHRTPRYLSLADMGAGVGQYGQALLASDRSVRYEAYDGAGNVEAWTHGFVQWADFTFPLSLPVADWVLSLEVGEHIPHASEAAYLANLDAHNRCGIILSWARLGQKGLNHFNNHGSEYLVRRLAGLGYVLNAGLTERLRASPSQSSAATSPRVSRSSPRRLPKTAASLPWLRHTLHAFERARPNAHCTQ